MNNFQESSLMAYEAIKEKLEGLGMAEEDQMERMLLKQKNMQDLKEHIDARELVGAYNAHKSTLGLAVDWYGRQALWTKVVMGVALVTIASLFHISIIITSLCYIGTGYLLQNHYEDSQVRDGLIFDDLKDLNESVASSIGFLDSSRATCENTTGVLYELGTQVANEFTSLSSKSASLEVNIGELSIVVAELSKAKEQQVEIIAELETSLVTANGVLADNESLLAEKSRRIEELLKFMDETNHSLDSRAAELTKTIDVYKQQSQDLVRLIDVYNEKISAVDCELSDDDFESDVPCMGTDVSKMWDEANELCRLADESCRETELLIATVEKATAARIETNDSEFRANTAIVC
ncbi:MAG: hypothetical protein NXI01_08850 [Gammaproteobacteria bacterium]|nr:hypothetical protein [Gammaproteobacteria bacterium]